MPKKRKDEESDEEEEEDSGVESEDESSSTEAKAKKVSKKTKKIKKKKKKDDSDDEDDSDDDKPKKKKKAAPKKKAAKGKKFVYSASQQSKYDEIVDDLKSSTIDALKTMLRTNEQLLKGNKQELINRIADAKVLGRVPRCPRCSGGRPKWIPDESCYRCPGFQDDDAFKFCNKKYTFEELPREKWIDED